MKEKANFPVKVMCEVMQVSRSGYYAYVQMQKRVDRGNRERLLVKVKAIHKASGQSYGSRRIGKALRDDGEMVGRYQTRTLMREAGIEVKVKRRYKATTDSKHQYPLAENLLDRQFEVSTPNRVWASDISYLWTHEGWLYLAVVLDLFSRRIVGWSLSNRMKVDLVSNALRMAIGCRKPPKGLLHHSDRGSQYACQDYQQLLKQQGITPSMSRKGNCWDNAVVERFFRSLKYERINDVRYRTREEAKRDVVDYIEMFYNSRRYHSYLGYRSPADYEKLAEVA